MTRTVLLSPVLMGILAATLAANCTAAASEKVLYDFVSARNGQYPENLVADGSGKFYGTTLYGGIYNSGVVYRFAPNGHGGWTQTVLHSFKGIAEGNSPVALVLGADGNLPDSSLIPRIVSCRRGCHLRQAPRPRDYFPRRCL